MKVLSDKELEELFETIQKLRDEIEVVREHLLDLGHDLMSYHLDNISDLIDDVENVLFYTEEAGT